MGIYLHFLEQMGETNIYLGHSIYRRFFMRNKEEGFLKVSSQSTRIKKRKQNMQVKKRTPRTIRVEENMGKPLPPVISEAFNFKNFDFVGKIDDMRSLTKELSIMARQMEQWMGIAYTVSMAFKDNGVLKDVIKAISNVGSGSLQSNNNPSRPEERSKEEKNEFSLPPSPFSFFDEGDRREADSPQNGGGKQKEPGFNLFEVINNPAFQEIVSKLFLQKR